MLSIVIPCYNCEKNILPCYASIKRALIFSDINEYEIILINDGSNDDTERVLNNINKEDNRTYIITQENKGVSSARNKGIEVSKGEYISFIDSDDTINEGFYCTYKKNKNGNADIYVCGVNGSIYPKLNGGIKQLTQEKYIDMILHDLNVQGYVWNKIHKKEILNNNNIKFDENVCFMEDKFFNLKYAKKIENIIFTLQNLYNYETQTMSIQGSVEGKITGLKVWNELINDDSFSDYHEEFKKEKFLWMVWLLGHLYAERFPGREKLLRELKNNRTYVDENISKGSRKYIQYRLLLRYPNLVGLIIRRKRG